MRLHDARVCVCTRVYICVTMSLWPEIKNSITHPDDLLRKLKRVDECEKEKYRQKHNGRGVVGGQGEKKGKDIGEIRRHRCRLRHIAELNK